MLQNETLLAKIGFDTEENEPAKVSRKQGVQNRSAGGHLQNILETSLSARMSEDEPLIPPAVSAAPTEV